MLVQNDIEFVPLGFADDPIQLFQPFWFQPSVRRHMGEGKHDHADRVEAGLVDGLEVLVLVIALATILPVGIVADDIDAAAHLRHLVGGADLFELRIVRQIQGLSIIGRHLGLVGRVILAHLTVHDVPHGRGVVDLRGGRHRGQCDKQAHVR